MQGIRAEEDSDESLSKPITVSLPAICGGNFEHISSLYAEDSSKELGRLQVKWGVQSHHKNVKQWNVIWYERDDGTLHKTGLEPHNTSCMIPVEKRK